MLMIGYARVSTEEQNLDLQLHALQTAGCQTIHRDVGVSGATRQRVGLDAALSELESGGVLVVWRLDRLGRSLPHLIDVVSTLSSRGCGFKSLTEAIDTTSAGGKLIFHIMGALAEFERSLIIERTRAGMQAAKRRGKHVGRPVKLRADQIEHARLMIDLGSKSLADMASLYRVSRTTLWRALNQQG